MRIASIDIGTNTIRLLIGEGDGVNLNKLLIRRWITRLGGGFSDNDRIIKDEPLSRSIAALGEAALLIKEYNVDKTLAVATSVVRQAVNSNYFLTKVKEETGIDVQIISGSKEGELTAYGALCSITVPTELSLIFDIGGGSTEYVLARNKTPLRSVSTSMGVVHLYEKYVNPSGIPNKENLTVLWHVIRNTIDKETAVFDKLSTCPFTLVATAGTPTTLAAIDMEMKSYDADLVNGCILNYRKALRIYERLISMSSQQRLTIAGLEKGREDLIIPGTIIVLATMERFTKDNFTVNDGGLLEGLAYSFIGDKNTDGVVF